MSDDFGGRLRRRREEQGVSLAAIAEKTKIKASLLEALERNDVAQWPHGIFRRAYIRSYAGAVGLDADLVVQEFLTLYPDRREMLPEDPRSSPSDDGRTSAPPTRFRYLMDSAMGSLGRRRRTPETDHAPAAPPIDRLDSIDKADTVDEPLPAAPIVPAAPRAAVSVFADPDLEALGRLAANVGKVSTIEDIQPLLLEAANVLHASGLIVWSWDEAAEELRPVLAAGYSDKMLAHVPALRRDADNVTADAFRFAQTCSIAGDARSNAALVVPMVTAAECIGVIALELPGIGEPAASLRAAASIVAALLALLLATAASFAESSAEPVRGLRR